jgi:hypothetical protein
MRTVSQSFFFVDNKQEGCDFIKMKQETVCTGKEKTRNKKSN